MNWPRERDARQETPAEPHVHAAEPDLTLIQRPAVGAEESSVAEPQARVAVKDQIVVGGIPGQQPGFLPRPVVLARLNQADRGALVVWVLTGAPGVGKTQLAGVWARARMAAGWRLVAWLNAGNAGNLLTGLAAVADAVGLSEGGHQTSRADAGHAVRRWLEADGAGCLLVFDDAKDPDVLRPFVPVTGAAQVLITADRESMTDLGTGVPVDMFSAAEAMALLTGRTGLSDEAGAAAVAAELGYLPLALDQAAAVIGRQHMGYSTYLGWLRTMAVGEYLIRGKEQPYSQGVAESVLVSLEALAAADRTGMTTGALEVMAVLWAGGVRRELLHAAGAAGALARGEHRVAAEQVDQALAQLAERALLALAVDGQAVFMHHLVARVIRERLIRHRQLGAVCRATASALEVYTKTLMELQDHAAVREALRQVTALLENATEVEDEADEELTKILLRLRFLALNCLIELGDSMPQAVAIGEQLTADLEWTLGSDHPDTLNAMNGLATAYRAAGRAAEAVPLFEQTLIGQVRLLGHDHRDTLTTQTNLATTYQIVGRAFEALLMLRLTLAANERMFGTGHPSTLNSQDNLAAAYRQLGRIAEAIPLLEQTLIGRERLLGANHPDTQRSRNNLAAAYKEAGRPDETIPLIEQILTVQERALGADHPKTLSSQNNLAVAYLEAGRPAEAIALFEQTLDACERLLGADDPRTLTTRNNLALARQRQEEGRADEASGG